MIIADLGTIITGKTPSTKNNDFWGGDIPFVTPGDIKGVKHIFHTERYITEQGANEVKKIILPKGAICVSCIGNIGYVGKTTQRCVTNQQINSIIVNDKHDADYVFYLIKSLWTFFKHYEGQSTTLSILNKTQFSQIEIPDRSLDEEIKIASILNSINDKIELNEMINKNLEQQASTLISQYCDCIHSTVELEKIMSFENGFAFQSKTYLSTGRYKIITIKNIKDGIIDSQGSSYINDIPKKMKPGCFLSIGDVLLSLTGNVGRTGIVYEDKLLLNQRVAKFIPKEKLLLPWLYYFFRLSSTKILLETIAKGTAQQNLSTVETLRIQVPFERNSMIKLVPILQSMFDNELNNFIESSNLIKLRNYLLPKLISGDVDISQFSIS